MFRKNTIERSHSAGTRVLASKKLPSDFFTPSRSTSKKDCDSWEPGKVRQVRSIERIQVRDSLLFTFNQGEQVKKMGFEEATTKLKKMCSSKLVKLPPVLLRIHRAPC
jgi:hypothetical protein